MGAKRRFKFASLLRVLKLVVLGGGVFEVVRLSVWLANQPSDLAILAAVLSIFVMAWVVGFLFARNYV